MRSDRRRAFNLVSAFALLARAPYRPVALAVVAALAGLASAGWSLAHTAYRDAATVPAKDVALVNGEPVLMEDFVSQTEKETGVSFADATPAQRAHVLHEMVDEELLVQQGLALDLPAQNTELRTALVDAINAQVIAPVLNAEPGDDQLKAYYAAHRDAYATEGSMSLTDLALHVGGFENAAQSVDQAMADAQQAAYELRSGATLDYVKQHFGFVDNNRASGLDADFAVKIYLGPKLFAVAQTMTDGQVSDPVATGDDVHLLVMHERKPPVFTDFEAVRRNVFNGYQVAQEDAAKRSILQFVRKSAKILVAPGQRE